MEQPPPKRPTETRALIVVVAILAVIGVAYVLMSGLDSAPIQAPAGESSATSAPYGTEPPKAMTDD